MTNIIFDGNYLFYKTMFVVKASTKLNKGERFLSDEKHRQILIQKISTDMAYAIRQFGKPDRIIFTIDHMSWRKDVEIEENDGYKSGRVKDDSTDWDAFYKCMNDFAKIIENKGVIVSRIERAEGDDLMYFWSQLFMNKNQNSIIVTGDKDMHQIVRATKNNYTVIFDNNSTRRTIYAAHGLQKWLNEEDEVDIFSSETYMNTSKDLIENALKKIKIQELNPIDFILIKILVGDDGDDVPSLFVWPTKKGDKFNRITPKRAQVILDHMKSSIDETLSIKNIINYPSQLIEGIRKVSKVKDIDQEKIINRLKRNIILVYLHKETIPKDIFTNFIAHAKENYKKTLSSKSYSKNMFIEGTQYDKPAASFTDSIFSQLDKL